MKKINIKSKVRYFLIIALLLIIFVRCDENQTYFPYVSINVRLSLDTQLGNMLVGEFKQVNGYGLGGLIIYRKDFNQFLAFDRACTHEASSSCILEDDADFTGIMVCPCCGSEFWMVVSDFSGMVKEGPANNPLKSYSCRFDGLNTITVTN
jgi:Rieske Fe-S protein